MTREEMITVLNGIHLPTWEELPDFGLYMDQMLTYGNRICAGSLKSLEITSNMINNYVKAGLIDRPRGKKYSRESLAQLLMISLLKVTTPMDVMRPLLRPGDNQSVQEMYQSFREASQDAVRRIAERDNQAPLLFALESAAMQIALRMQMDEA